MFLNSTNYLLGDYSLVSIRPKALPWREFNLDRNEYDFVRFLILAVPAWADGTGRRAGLVAAALNIPSPLREKVEVRVKRWERGC